uniref:Uncharacterized protein n=1 Tax=Ciona savignyi TaxID=51511 RepID=H2ZNN1_CIOSA
MFHTPTIHLPITRSFGALWNKNCSGITSCRIRCDHGLVLYTKTGCCKCTCKRGYTLANDSRTCLKVSFQTWSTWSPCIASEWGGIQHRERLCKTRQGKSANNRCVGAGSQSRTCS